MIPNFLLSSDDGIKHKVPQCMYVPPRRNWYSPTPSPASECAGLGESQFRFPTTGEKA